MASAEYRPGGGVALTQDEPVPVFPLGAAGIDVHFLEVQIGKHIRRGQTAAGMIGLGAMGRVDDTHAPLAGNDLQLLLFRFCHASSHYLCP